MRKKAGSGPQMPPAICELASRGGESDGSILHPPSREPGVDQKRGAAFLSASHPHGELGKLDHMFILSSGLGSASAREQGGRDLGRAV